MSRFSPTGQVPMRILLVEDSAADADLLLEMLEDEFPGALVSVAVSVADAVPMLAGELDIVITDLSLPDAEGLQALTAIRVARPDIGVVIMTGRQDRQLALEALSAGAEDYLVKGSADARAFATAVLYAAERGSAEHEAHRYERLALGLLDATETSTCAVDRAGSIVAVNRAWRDFWAANGGDPSVSSVGSNYLEVCRKAAGDEVGASEVGLGLQRLLAGELDRFESDYACHSPAEERWFSLRINPLPEGSGAVVTHVDITAMKLAERALSHQSLHDALTGLPNRNLLGDRLAQALVWAERSSDDAVAVAFLDLDGFKRINDTYGHACGDALLSAVAERLAARVRTGDTISRYAGDEFVVVWPNVKSADEAKALAERLLGAFQEPFHLGDERVAASASVGVAVGRPPDSADTLLLAADAAMYEAKSLGRGRLGMYTETLREGVELRLRTESELRVALVRHEFVLHYQPVVDLRTSRVTGVEALARWYHPDGLRMPDDFIPVAESSGLIVPLGAWVLEEACQQAAIWAAAGLDLHMAVNLSARQVTHPTTLATIEGALNMAGLPAHRLLVEVTESAVMEDAESAMLALTRIGELGAAIAIDDFGTGYSSLLYLKRYPIRALKVDRSFVSGMGVTYDDDAIVTSVVTLARAVGAVSIAEGVETREQHVALLAIGCDFGQGYLYGRPVAAADLPVAVEACEQLLDAYAKDPWYAIRQPPTLA